MKERGDCKREQSVADFSKSAPPTGTDNAGLFILRDDRFSIVFLLVVEFMVVSGRGTARVPTPRQEND